MNTTFKRVNQNICENLLQIQGDLEVLSNKFFEQVGSNIQAEKQAKYTQVFDETKQVIETLKSKYCTYIYKEK